MTASVNLAGSTMIEKSKWDETMQTVTVTTFDNPHDKSQQPKPKKLNMKKTKKPETAITVTSIASQLCTRMENRRRRRRTRAAGQCILVACCVL
jgi:hypothetical protein